jgi:hypothetical protein
MQWMTDPATTKAAAKYPIHIRRSSPVGPFRGRRFNTNDWNHRVIQPASWSGVLRSDPDQIIQQFQNQRYTQGLAMVVSWGTMWRKPDAVWGDRKIETIDATLHSCAESIRKTESIADSWVVLWRQMMWTSVLISKTLHFLCLSLGFEHDPPVPIDGAVVRQRVWPAFRDPIPFAERPGNWNGDTFEPYSRYMSAILMWANQRQWSTAETERTLCLEFEEDWSKLCS